ncbi:hypothetical protein MYAM1_000154 [Malassezia yamatoensis]|uniref:Hikeshi-like N-terminal domain-containing protein n=1 Tax=Malassezia yamatoensis TaxID=253288 RepID=A0AAJ5YP02_9BASI|nr:hypothetical protein MYAM1_000154 [Malassezia yamatoensis]
MFSCVVAGRLPLPPPQQIDATHAVFQLESAEQINHLVVFMTGEQAFPEGYAATVHMMWPQPTGAEPKWQLLGWYAAAHLHISIQNTKPSAIFRVRDPKRDPSMGPVTATLGISVETLEQVEQEMQTLGDSKPASNSMVLAKNGPASPLNEAAQLAAPIALA